MNQHTGTGLPPVHHDHGEARYALTDAGHGALAPTGVPPSPPGVVLACIDCDHVYEPTAADLAAGHTGCPDPDCDGWTWSSALTVAAPTDPAGGGR